MISEKLFLRKLEPYKEIKDGGFEDDRKAKKKESTAMSFINLPFRADWNI